MKEFYYTPKMEDIILCEMDVITNPSSWGMTDGGAGNDDFGDDYENIIK